MGFKITNASVINAPGWTLSGSLADCYGTPLSAVSFSTGYLYVGSTPYLPIVSGVNVASKSISIGFWDQSTVDSSGVPVLVTGRSATLTWGSCTFNQTENGWTVNLPPMMPGVMDPVLSGAIDVNGNNTSSSSGSSSADIQLLATAIHDHSAQMSLIFSTPDISEMGSAFVAGFVIPFTCALVARAVGTILKMFPG